MALRKYSGTTLFLLMSMALSCACGGGASRGPANASASAGQNASQERTGPVKYGYAVKNTYPHSTSSYTQGLYWHDGHLWEGTGQHGQSALMKVDMASGKALKTVRLPEEYFGEGIALLGGKIYQLTWLDGVALVYDAATLKKTGEFRYRGEGWGLTTDGEYLYMSDGSDRIFVLDPVDFGVERSFEVKIGSRGVRYLNELEWIGGKIWANVYMSDSIVIIDPQTGAVEGVIDMTGLLPPSERTPDTDVLNGIAYDREGYRILVTGKNWPRVYEIEIKEKQ